MGNEVVEHRIGNLEKRVDGLEQDRRELDRLSTLMEMQLEANNKQDDFLREQSITLIKMNENLSTLNSTTIKLNEDVESLKNNITAEKINSMDAEVKRERDTSIHIPSLIRNGLYTLLTTGLIAGVIYLIKVMN